MEQTTSPEHLMEPDRYLNSAWASIITALGATIPLCFFDPAQLPDKGFFLIPASGLTAWSLGTILYQGADSLMEWLRKELKEGPQMDNYTGWLMWFILAPLFWFCLGVYRIITCPWDNHKWFDDDPAYNTALIFTVSLRLSALVIIILGVTGWLQPCASTDSSWQPP